MVDVFRAWVNTKVSDISEMCENVKSLNPNDDIDIFLSKIREIAMLAGEIDQVSSGWAILELGYSRGQVARATGITIPGASKRSKNPQVIDTIAEINALKKCR